MKLNLNILCNELDCFQVQSYFNSSPTIFPLAYPQYCAQLPLTPDFEVLYVISSEHLPKSSDEYNGIHLFVLGKPSASWFQPHISMLYTLEHFDEQQVLNELIKIFHKYHRWEETMQDVIDKKMPMTEFGWLSIPFIQNPIYILSGSFRLLMHCIPKMSEHPTELYLNYIKTEKNISESVLLTKEDILLLISDSEFQKTNQTRVPAISQAENYPFRILYYNITINDTVIAKICIPEIIREIRDCDLSYIKIISDYVQKSISYTKISPLNRPEDMDEILSALLNHKLLPERKILDMLNNLHWDMNDAYFCMSLHLKTSSAQPNALSALAIPLSDLLSNECYTIFQNNIVFICNLSKLNKSKEHYFAEIQELLRDNLLAGCTSTTFYDFKDVYYYYQQALMAEKIGFAENDTQWYYHFEQYHLRYFLKQCYAQFPARTLIPERLNKLIRYDMQKERSYAKLLKCFLDTEQNISETARILYLHRNTCIRQLRRIQEITGLDFHDPNTRLLLNIAFRILETKQN